MFNSTIIDIAISLIFIYISLSLICMTITEILTRKRNSREKVFDETFKALFESLTGEDGQKALEAFKKKIHTILGVGEAAPGKKPDPNLQIKSYSKIEPGTVAVAMFDTLMEKGFISSDGTIKKQLNNKKLSGKVSPDSLLETLIGVEKTAITKALSGPIKSIKDQVMEKIEGWTGSVLDKIQQTYRKKAEFFALVVASIVVVINNADTINMTLALKQDLYMRDMLVNASAELVRSDKENQNTPAPDATQPEDSMEAAPISKTTEDIASEPQKAEEQGDQEAQPAAVGTKPGPSDEIKKYLQTIDKSGIPFGPDSWATNLPKLDSPKCFTNIASFIYWLLKKIIGLSATIALVSLGAPFWLDTLKKIMELKKKKE